MRAAMKALANVHGITFAFMKSIGMYVHVSYHFTFNPYLFSWCFLINPKLFINSILFLLIQNYSD